MNKTVSFARHQAVGAYRRWEPQDFDAPPPKPEHEPEAVPVVTPSPAADALSTTKEAEPTPPPVLLPTVEEIEQIHEEARRSGFDEGFAEGHKKGYAEGRETGFQEGRDAGFSEGSVAAGNEARQLHELTVQLKEALAKLDAEIAEELMSLAVELARKILQHSLAVVPEALVSAIRAILQSLPQSRAQIHLNPDDLALVRSYLGEVLDQSEHVLIEDESVTHGGCRVETPGAQIDATMETRWRRTIDALGREHGPWIATGERRTKMRRASDKPPAKTRAKTSSAKGSDQPEPPSTDATPSNPGDSPAVPDAPPEPSQ